MGVKCNRCAEGEYSSIKHITIFNYYKIIHIQIMLEQENCLMIFKHMFKALNTYLNT